MAKLGTEMDETGQGACQPTCTFHGDAIVSTVTWAKNPQQLEKLLSNVCTSGRPWRMKDSTGKSILHLAAAQGKVELMEWYFKQLAMDTASPERRSTILNQTDAENGWTALHHALYHGEISAAYNLIKKGADMNIRDHDGYSPLQLLIFDAGPILNQLERFPNCTCCIVAFFTWGNNCNFTLGFGDDQARSFPEKVRAHFAGKNCAVITSSDGQVEMGCDNCQRLGREGPLKRPTIAKGEIHMHQGRCPHFYASEKSGSIAYLKNPLKSLSPYSRLEHELYSPKLPLIDIVLRKFHTLFLTPDNSVYSCGHGQGLGLNTEKTVLQPTKVTFASPVQPEVMAVSAGLNHSVFLTKEEYVFTCGSNEFGQLGLDSAPAKVLIPTRLSLFGPSISQKGNAAGSRINFHLREGQFGVAADRFHTLIWTGRGLYACGYNAGQLGPPSSSDFNRKSGSTFSTSDLCWKTPHEISQVRSFVSPARFVKCSDAATLICSNNLEMVLMHDYEIRRLARLPLLVRVQPNEEYQLSELCIFGGNLHSPNSQLPLKRDLVIVALAFGIPLLYTDQNRGSWRPISIHGIPRDMSQLHHISLSYDCLLVATSYGECYSIKLSNCQSHSTLAPFYRAQRVSKLWRAIKVFSEPASGNFAVIQMVGRSKQLPGNGNMDSNRGEVIRFEEQEEEPNEPITPEMMFELTRNEKFQAVIPYESLWEARGFGNSSDDSHRALKDQQARRRYKKEKLKLAVKTSYENAGGLWDVEADLQFVCDDDGEKINAHRDVLIGKSLYFQLLLEGKRWEDLSVKSPPVLPCDLKTGLRLVEFIYNGGLDERPHTMQECLQLLCLADFLIFEKLREYAGSLFEPFLNHDLLYSFYRLAQIYSSDALNHLCIAMMTSVIPDLVESHHLETLERFTVEQLNWTYREQHHLHQVILDRIISPHHIPGWQRGNLDQMTARKFEIDEEMSNETSSDAAAKSTRKSKTIPKSDPQPSRDLSEKVPKFQTHPGSSDTIQKAQEKNVSDRLLPPIERTGKSVKKCENLRGVDTNQPKELNEKTTSQTGLSSRYNVNAEPQWSKEVLKTPSQEKSRLQPTWISPAPSSISLSKSTEVKGLSTIMAEERHTQKAIKLASMPKSRKKFVGKKLSEEAQEPPKPVESTVPKGNPWQVASPFASTPLSGIISSQSVAFPVRNASLIPSSKPHSMNWKASSSSSGRSEEKMSLVSGFVDIQRDEAEQIAQLERSQRRPLGLIQFEERAVEELLEFYGAINNPEEWITVERVLPKQAKASWSARE